jgi:aldehyde dehydrogenase (NAD+)
VNTMDLIQTLHLSNINSAASTGQRWWSRTQSNGEIVSYNPTSGAPIASIYRANNDDYEYVITEAKQAFLSWRLVPAPKRGEVIHAIGEELRRQKDLLGSLVSLEMGKSKQEGDGEVQEMIDMADLAVGQSRMLYGHTMHSERPDHRMFEQWHPLGVTAVITAFNFPVAVWAWNAFLAAICGNTVIWKPSPKTALCAIAVQHICNHVLENFGYQGIFSLLISDDNKIVEQIANDQRIHLVSFTGSSAVGRHINTLVAKRLGRTLLELSGNNAIIIDATADLNLAIPSVVFGAIGTAGQRCTSTRRLFIHESTYDKCLNALTKAYSHISIGDPLDQKNLMGPLIDQAAVEQFVNSVNKAKLHGGKILFGGNTIKRAGFFVEPTIIEAENSWEIVQHETFAPILYVMKFTEIDDAIAMQNDSAYGLSSALFTQNLHQSEVFLSARGSDCGIANINVGTSGAEIGGAFGGEKDTGGGREAGSDAWKAYMRRQTTTIHFGHTNALAQGIKFDIL